ncbi:MAG: thioesterase family protein [Ferruginibacter sp.]
MSRVKIEMPGKIIFVTDIPVRITDINYGNHVGNDALVSLVQEARVKLLQRAGYKNELEIDGVGLIMAGLSMEYKKESFYGDILHIAIGVDEISEVGFNLYYKINAERGEEMMLVAKAKTEMVCFNYSTKRISPIPTGLRSFLEKN